MFCEGFCPVAGVWELFLQKLEIISHKCIMFIIRCTEDQLQCAVFATYMTTGNFALLPLVRFFIFSCLWQFLWNLLLYAVNLIYSFICAGNSKISQDEIRHGWVAKFGGQSKSGFNVYFLAASTIPLAVIDNAKSKCADFGGASTFLLSLFIFLFRLIFLKSPTQKKINNLKKNVFIYV